MSLIVPDCPFRRVQVYHVLKEMDRTGVDFFVDVHGDEALPFAFLAGSEGLSVWGSRMAALHGAFVNAYARANPDMQAKFGYTPDPPNEGNLAICSNQARAPEHTSTRMPPWWCSHACFRLRRHLLLLVEWQVSHRFDCLGVTLEMPFKDSLALPPRPDVRRLRLLDPMAVPTQRAPAVIFTQKLITNLTSRCYRTPPASTGAVLPPWAIHCWTPSPTWLHSSVSSRGPTHPTTHWLRASPCLNRVPSLVGRRRRRRRAKLRGVRR